LIIFKHITIKYQNDLFHELRIIIKKNGLDAMLPDTKKKRSLLCNWLVSLML
jgi:hypothetical protein